MCGWELGPNIHIVRGCWGYIFCFLFCSCCLSPLEASGNSCLGEWKGKDAQHLIWIQLWWIDSAFFRLCYTFDQFCPRILRNEQETLEDYDSCGIFGEEDNRANYRANRARIGDDYECLWDCEWEENPFYKSADIYEASYTPTGILRNFFPLVHTSPQL